MAEETDWRVEFAEADARMEKQLKDASSKNSVNRDFYSAGLSALQSMRADKLTPDVSKYGEVRYSVQQDLKAACHARQDVTAILLVQEAVLNRLQELRTLAWICLLVLIYIAYRIS